MLDHSFAGFESTLHFLTCYDRDGTIFPLSIFSKEVFFSFGCKQSISTKLLIRYMDLDILSSRDFGGKTQGRIEKKGRRECLGERNNTIV